MESQKKIGGAKYYSGKYRNFKIVHLNGKDVKLDYIAKIKETQTPLNAAKKLLKSICLHQRLKGMKKLNCVATYVIKETTQDSSKKTYGPYKGSYVKYTPAEAKKAMASGISFKMKPSVKLSKKIIPKKNKPIMKGGNIELDTWYDVISMNPEKCACGYNNNCSGICVKASKGKVYGTDYKKLTYCAACNGKLSNISENDFKKYITNALDLEKANLPTRVKLSGY
jgi:hypothetical protein